MGRIQTNFRAEDFQDDDGDGAANSVAPSPAPVKKPAGDPNKVPEGTSQEILEWVDGDVNKARKALAVEKKDDNPRESLTGPLNEIIEKDRREKREARVAKAKKDQAANVTHSG